MPNVIVAGAQWGDEGKGKIVDLLTSWFDVIVRYQGGHNAGHTVFVEGRKIILHLIPSGIVRPGKICVIGNGVVIDLKAFWAEINMLMKMGISVEGRLFVSDRAHLIFPYHRAQERLEEQSRGKQKIDTTNRGIGPSYEDKFGRRGLRVADLQDLVEFRKRLQAAVEIKTRQFPQLSDDTALTGDALFEEYRERASKLRDFTLDTSNYINEQWAASKRILLEGAQGLLLDIDHGTYPFVTSSSCAAAGACSGAGISPRRVDGILGVAKAYCTRVGGGPFPSESENSMGEALRKLGNEFGASTGRPRRCGWFDVMAMRYAQTLNGYDTLAITKLDVLDTFDEIPVCVGYKYRGSQLSLFPAEMDLLEQCEPIYETRRGWHAETSGLRQYDKLPQAARDYLMFLEDQVEVEISIVSTGMDREDVIFKRDCPGLKNVLPR